MNYYSRNSPVKNKNKNIDPGFLILNRYNNFTARTVRSLTTRTVRSNRSDLNS